MTGFSMLDFIAELGSDSKRVAKGYLYEVAFTFGKLSPELKPTAPVDDNVLRKLTFFCSSANIPGYRSDTQRASIYGLPYEVVTRIEQDPLWLSFYADILHKIPNLFFAGIKAGPQAFSVYGDNGEGTNDLAPYTPRYKTDYQFNIDLSILDENFKAVSIYKFTECFIKTVQQVALGAGNNNVPEVTIEIIYERVTSQLVGGHSRATVIAKTVTKQDVTLSSTQKLLSTSGALRARDAPPPQPTGLTGLSGSSGSTQWDNGETLWDGGTSTWV